MSITELRWNWIEVLWDGLGWEWSAGIILDKQRLALPFGMDFWNMSDGNRYREYNVHVRFLVLDAYIGASHYRPADTSSAGTPDEANEVQS